MWLKTRAHVRPSGDSRALVVVFEQGMLNAAAMRWHPELMDKSRLDAPALLLALAVGGVLLFLAAPANFGFVTTIAGVILLIVLFGYDQEGTRSVLQSLAFAAVAGFALMLALGMLYEYTLAHANVAGPAAREGYLQTRFALTWLFASILFWVIDRARMSGRVASEARLVVPGRSASRAFLPDLATPSAPPPSYAPAPPQAAPAPPPSYATPPRPAPQAAPAPPPPVRQAPLHQEHTVSSAPTPIYFATQISAPTGIPPQRPMFEESTARIPVAAPKQETVSPPPSVPAPQPIPVTGKVTPIYVNLVGEGLNVLRSVQAEHLGHDFYRIVDNMPEGEEWAFKPGQVVRCRKQKLSSGKALVAYEEAPRAQ